jgi:type I restriction-modification system DNA methylase subunit
LKPVFTPEKPAPTTPDDVAKIKILDPTCGSGSFLLGAYQYLLNWHVDYYKSKVIVHKVETHGNASTQKNNRPPQKFKDDFFFDADGEVKLTTKKKGEILVNNIFGVDIDREATEVAILSLYLKLLEEGIDDDGFLFLKGKVLPDMTNNIKCGNSLIEMDYFEGKFDFATQEMKEIKPFDWKNEFKEIFTKNGFDCVMGNPPYVRQEILGEKFKKYAKNKYKTFSGTADLYVYFIEKFLSLLNPEGLYSVIVANKWMRANYGEALRIFLKNKKKFEIIDFGDKGATTYPCILNSKITTWIYSKLTSTIRGGYLRWIYQYVEQISIPNSPSEEIKSKIISFVEQILATQTEIQSVKTETDKNLFQKKCDMIDDQIDRLVYKLYDLTEEEIKVVEVKMSEL